MGAEYLLIENFRRGDTASFTKLYELHSGKVYNFVLKLSQGDTYLAEEIVQNVFIKLWQVREDIDPAKSLSSFVCTIAKNMVINVYLHKMHEATYRNAIKYDISQSVEYTTEKEVDYQFLESYIDSLIEKLPPVRRQIFILSRRQHLRNKEIAQQLSLSENTVESQLSKAISFIKKNVHADYGVALLPFLFFLIEN